MLDPKEQFERFLETAQKLQLDETGQEAKRAFASLVKAKRRKSLKGEKGS